MIPFALAIHGGAGTITKEIDPAPYLAVLHEALDAGYAVLSRQGSAIDAVAAAVLILEDFPLYNAGRGAVYNHDTRHELDAAVMDGANRKAGAIGGATKIRNPVLAARAVMEHSPHVLLTGDGANHFAAEHGLKIVENAWFNTDHRLKQLHQAQQKNKIQLDFSDDEEEPAMGTVGAVALDVNGNLAAATSTGGLTNKAVGRVGDTPIIGAGTYAENGVCAISATGTGDEIIRIVMAHDIAARMKYLNENIETASAHALEQLKSLNGDGGLIAVTQEGKIHMPFISRGMFRGSRSAADTENFAAIF
ncbi:MAG: isoaspartyl peptidase/L-asparaginase [Pseudomonadota bacterium]|nr:isoaspartyl peptidase/L-asparaginase [Pseudomonadota bacterium]QKK06296.1 MAG: isoaspartyl peptidase/L-asparaginase [Pseudomonadota bacterium]